MSAQAAVFDNGDLVKMPDVSPTDGQGPLTPSTRGTDEQKATAEKRRNKVTNHEKSEARVKFSRQRGKNIYILFVKENGTERQLLQLTGFDDSKKEAAHFVGVIVVGCPRVCSSVETPSTHTCALLPHPSRVVNGVSVIE
jgi:hypothetical protein